MTKCETSPIEEQTKHHEGRCCITCDYDYADFGVGAKRDGFCCCQDSRIVVEEGDAEPDHG